jgi:hypothetical protein
MCYFFIIISPSYRFLPNFISLDTSKISTITNNKISIEECLAYVDGSDDPIACDRQVLRGHECEATLQFKIVVSNNQDVNGSVPTDVELAAVIEHFSPFGASVENATMAMSDPSCPDIVTNVDIPAGTIIAPGDSIIIQSAQVHVNTCLCPQFVFTVGCKGVPVTNTTSPDDRESTTNDTTVCVSLTSFVSRKISASS